MKRFIKNSIILAMIAVTSVCSTLVSYAGNTVNVDSIYSLGNNGVVTNLGLIDKFENHKYVKNTHKSMLYNSYDKYEKERDLRKSYIGKQYISERFITSEDGNIQVQNEDGSGVMMTAWFKDNDGRWYAFDKDGNLLKGIIQDVSRKNTIYILNPTDGEVGALVHTNGNYELNGKIVHLTFNNNHDGHFGTLVSNVEGIFK